MELKGMGGREGDKIENRIHRQKTRYLEMSAPKEQLVTLDLRFLLRFLFGLK